MHVVTFVVDAVIDGVAIAVVTTVVVLVVCCCVVVVVIGNVVFL